MTKAARLALIKRIASQNGIGSNDSHGLLAPTSYDVEDERNAIRTSLGDDSITSDRLETSFLQELVFEGGQD